MDLRASWSQQQRDCNNNTQGLTQGRATRCDAMRCDAMRCDAYSSGHLTYQLDMKTNPSNIPLCTRTHSPLPASPSTSYTLSTSLILISPVLFGHEFLLGSFWTVCSLFIVRCLLSSEICIQQEEPNLQAKEEHSRRHQTISIKTIR